jgi:putative SOS response-associated peptidase YedK
MRSVENPSVREADAFVRTGAPAQMLPVFRRHPETGEPIQGELRWGLIPHYADRRPDLQPIHARAETITEQRMFRDAYRTRRCIVPMTSFNLKDQNGRRRAISRIDGASFGVAGIWENWKEPSGSRWERTFAVITVPANKLIASIHNRMPAILHNHDFKRWLGSEDDPRDLLVPYAGDDLVVSPPAGKSRRRP